LVNNIEIKEVYTIELNSLTKPSSVELSAALLGFGVGLLGGFCIAGWLGGFCIAGWLGGFCIAGWLGGIKQPTYLWQR